MLTCPEWQKEMLLVGERPTPRYGKVAYVHSGSLGRQI